MNRKRSWEINNSSGAKRAKRLFKPLSVNVQRGSSQCPSPLQEQSPQNKSKLLDNSQTCSPKNVNGFQNKLQLLENSQNSSPKTENGFQEELQMLKSSQTSTPKTLQAARRSLQKTIEMFNSQEAKKISLLNTSWPGSKDKRKLKPLPICVSDKKLGITQMESEINTTRFMTENQSPTLQVLTPKSCQRSWHRFMSGVLTTTSNCGEYSNDISIETTPNTQFALTSTYTIQSTPNAIRKSTIKSKLKCVKGGYLQEYKKMLQEMDIEQRHLNLSLQKPSHIVSVLRIWETVGIKMALVKSETEPEAGPIIFSIIITPDLADSVAVGSRLQLYLNEEPLEMPNKQYLHMESNKVILL